MLGLQLQVNISVPSVLMNRLQQVHPYLAMDSLVFLLLHLSELVSWPRNQVRDTNSSSLSIMPVHSSLIQLLWKTFSIDWTLTRKGMC